MSMSSYVFVQAELAAAAYADLAAGIPTDEYIRALVAANMSPFQAKTFAKNWRIVDRYSDATGVSATVFADASGKT